MTSTHKGAPQGVKTGACRLWKEESSSSSGHIESEYGSVRNSPLGGTGQFGSSSLSPCHTL